MSGKNVATFTDAGTADPVIDRWGKETGAPATPTWHDAAGMNPTFFEGPEKKVELVMVPSAPALRNFGESFWHGVVRAADAQVLSTLRSETCDAYLLSESSLFVYDDHLTMITCGQTRLVNAVETMLTRVPPEDVALLIYERKNENFPERQPTTFRQDAARLNGWLPGTVLHFGDENGHHVELFHTNRTYHPGGEDSTLEILMHGLAPAVTAQYFGGRVGADRLAFTSLLPGFEVDEHAFTPAGYSMNALRGSDYYTIHVTPENVGSYVSFETNVALENMAGLVGGVVACFQPSSFDIMAFAAPVLPPVDLNLAGFETRSVVRKALHGYEVEFRHCVSLSARCRKSVPG